MGDCVCVRACVRVWHAKSPLLEAVMSKPAETGSKSKNWVSTKYYIIHMADVVAITNSNHLTCWSSSAVEGHELQCCRPANAAAAKIYFRSRPRKA